MSQFFASGSQKIGVSASTSVFPMNIWTDFLEDGLVGSPCSPSDSQESSPTPQFKSTNSSVLSFLYSPTLTSIHDYGKTRALTRQTFISKVMSLFFNMLSRLVIAFLPRSKHLLISWLQSPSAVIWKPKKIKPVTVSPSIYHEVMGLDAMILVFWMLSCKPAFSLSSFFQQVKVFMLNYFIFLNSIFIKLLNWRCVCACSVMSNSVIQQTAAHQAPLSIEFSRQKYWSGLPFPTPGDLPDPRDQTQISGISCIGRHSLYY